MSPSLPWQPTAIAAPAMHQVAAAAYRDRDRHGDTGTLAPGPGAVTELEHSSFPGLPVSDSEAAARLGNAHCQLEAVITDDHDA